MRRRRLRRFWRQGGRRLRLRWSGFCVSTPCRGILKAFEPGWMNARLYSNVRISAPLLSFLARLGVRTLRCCSGRRIWGLRRPGCRRRRRPGGRMIRVRRPVVGIVFSTWPRCSEVFHDSLQQRASRVYQPPTSHSTSHSDPHRIVVLSCL